jgi:hypothetical protein
MWGNLSAVASPPHGQMHTIITLLIPVCPKSPACQPNCGQFTLLHPRPGRLPGRCYAGFRDRHVAIFHSRVPALRFFGHRHPAGHVRGYRGAVADGMHAVGTGNLPAEPGVARSVGPAARFGLPAFQGRVRMPAESAAGSVGPGVGFTPALGTALVMDFPLRPLPGRNFPVVPVAVPLVFPQWRHPAHVGKPFWRSAHLISPFHGARIPGHAQLIDLILLNSFEFFV